MSTTVRVEWNDTTVKAELKKATQAGSLEAAEHVAKLAKAFAPVSNKTYSGKSGGKSWQARKPGTLRNTIAAYKSKYKDGGAVVASGSDNAFYTRFVELGTPGATRRVRVKKGKRKDNARTPIKANPFLGKALNASTATTRMIIANEMKRILKK